MLQNEKLIFYTILFFVFLFTSNFVLQEADSVKSKGTDNPKFGSATKQIVCGDKLCSEQSGIIQQGRFQIGGVTQQSIYPNPTGAPTFPGTMIGGPTQYQIDMANYYSGRITGPGPQQSDWSVKYYTWGSKACPCFYNAMMQRQIDFYENTKDVILNANLVNMARNYP